MAAVSGEDCNLVSRGLLAAVHCQARCSPFSLFAVVAVMPLSLMPACVVPLDITVLGVLGVASPIAASSFPLGVRLGAVSVVQ